MSKANETFETGKAFVTSKAFVTNETRTANDAFRTSKTNGASKVSGIYGEHLSNLESVKDIIVSSIDSLRESMKNEFGSDPVEHCLARIKSEESMREKCRRYGVPETTKSALEIIHDAIGIRVVCAFISDVYAVRDHLVNLDGVKLTEEKDYIKDAKPNGYRSLHLILKYKDAYFVEVQLRTVSMDTWATLEHHIHYKKEITANDELIISELKRCADELASTDMSMQTIRDLIRKQTGTA